MRESKLLLMASIVISILLIVYYTPPYILVFLLISALIWGVIPILYFLDIRLSNPKVIYINQDAEVQDQIEKYYKKKYGGK